MALDDFNREDFTFLGVHRYRTNGVNMPKKDRGTRSYIWGLNSFPSQISVAQGVAGSVEAGTYIFQAVGYSSQFNNRSQPIDLDGVQITLTADSAVDITNIPTFDDHSVDTIEIYRTLKNELEPFYLVETVPNGTASKVTNKADVDIGTIAPVLEPVNYQFLRDSELNFAGPFRYDPPPLKPFVEVFDGRLWMGGEKPYEVGTVSAVDGEPYITGSSQVNWNSRHLGRFLQIIGEDRVYEIEFVETGNRIRLTEDYVRPSWRTGDPVDVDYCIVGDPNEVLFSEVDSPDYFPITNSLNVGLEEGGFITGLIADESGLHVFTESNIYTIYRTGASDIPYGIRKTRSTVGTSSPYSITKGLGGLIMFYSDGRFYGFDGNDSTVMSKELGEKIKIYPGTDLHVLGTRVRDRVYFAVAETNDLYLDKLYVFDGVFTFWDTPWDNLRMVDIQAVTHSDSSEHLYFAEFGDTYKLSRFSEAYKSDGVGYGIPIGNVSLATSDTLTDDVAPFPGGIGYSGAIVRIDSGLGAGQVRRILGNTNDTLTMEDNWDIIPDATSTYMIGGIESQILSGRIAVGDIHSEKDFFEIEYQSGGRGEK